MPSYQPGIEKAVQWITSLIHAGHLAVGETLPPIRALSRQCGVSTVTMNKAIVVLRANGAIAGVKGQRSIVSRPGASGREEELPPPVVTPLSATARIEAELHRRILLGELGPDTPFPSQKELQQGFGASHRTIRGVMQRLHEKGLLDIRRRWYGVKHIRMRGTTARVVLIGFTFGPYNTLVRAHHDSFIQGLLQTECWQRNVPLEQVGYSLDTHEFLGLDDLKPYSFTDDILGCIVLLNQITESWPRLFSTVASLRVPVAIIDEFGHWDVAEAFPSRGKVRVFSFSSGKLAAEEVTRILVRRGHRQIAYISPHKNFAWSDLRSDAVRGELTRAGLADNFHPQEFDIREMDPQLSQEGAAEKMHAEVTRFLSAYPPIFQGAYARIFNPAMWGMRMMDVAIEQNLRTFLEPLLRRRDITAWIAVNDDTAIIAKRLLQENRIGVPRDVSLASFDDSPQAHDMRIASYNFNVSGLVSSVVNFITSRFDSRTNFAADRVEIPGMLIERSSIGSAGTAEQTRPDLF